MCCPIEIISSLFTLEMTGKQRNKGVFVLSTIINHNKSIIIL